MLGWQHNASARLFSASKSLRLQLFNAQPRTSLKVTAYDTSAPTKVIVQIVHDDHLEQEYSPEETMWRSTIISSLLVALAASTKTPVSDSSIGSAEFSWSYHGRCERYFKQLIKFVRGTWQTSYLQTMRHSLPQHRPMCQAPQETLRLGNTLQQQCIYCGSCYTPLACLYADCNVRTGDDNESALLMFLLAWCYFRTKASLAGHRQA